MKCKKSSISLLLSLIIFLFGCSENRKETVLKEYQKFDEIPDVAWQDLSKKRIYFGHQSVGYNIIDGIKDIMNQYPNIKLNIQETSDIRSIKGGALFNSTIGKNNDPKSKIDGFINVMESGLGDGIDIAFFKFCFVDIKYNTNVQNVFDYYVKEMKQLKIKYPKVTFVHLTVPLTIRQTGIKAIIKKIIGKRIWGIEDNIKRNQFNDMLRQYYSGKEYILDIARVESMKPDGNMAVFNQKGEVYYELYSKYTDDGGHLNKIGSRMVGKQFLTLLANISHE